MGVHEAVEACRAPRAFVWIGLYEPEPRTEFESIRSEFELHELAVEDAIHAHQRPKLEVYDDMVFVVLKTARYVDPEEVVELGEILIFVGERFMVTVRHGRPATCTTCACGWSATRSCSRTGPARCCTRSSTGWWTTTPRRSRGSARTSTRSRRGLLRAAHQPGRAHLQAQARGARVPPRHRAAGGAPLNRLARGQSDVIHPEVRAYFRDVNDHLLRVHEQLESYRDLLTSVLEANLAQVSVRQNEDVRKISAVGRDPGRARRRWPASTA